MSSALIPYNDLERIGNVLAKSKLFGMKTPEEAIALCLIAQAEGKHPATAAQEYHVIQGRPALKADAMLARFQAAGGKVDWKSYTDQEVTGVFSHPQGGSVQIKWSIEMAKKLGYLSKDNWQKFPRAMMRARCISEGVRTVYPGIAVGIYTPEEVQDFDSNGGPVIENEPAHDPVTGEVNKAAPYFKTATLRNTFTKETQEKLQKALSVDEANMVIRQVKDKLEGMRAGDSRDALAVESIQNTYRLVLTRFQSAEQNKASAVAVEDGGLTPEEMEAYENERVVMASRLADDPPAMLKRPPAEMQY